MTCKVEVCWLSQVGSDDEDVGFERTSSTWNLQRHMPGVNNAKHVNYSQNEDAIRASLVWCVSTYQTTIYQLNKIHSLILQIYSCLNIDKFEKFRRHFNMYREKAIIEGSLTINIWQKQTHAQA